MPNCLAMCSWSGQRGGEHAGLHVGVWQCPLPHRDLSSPPPQPGLCKTWRDGGSPRHPPMHLVLAIVLLGVPEHTVAQPKHVLVGSVFLVRQLFQPHQGPFPALVLEGGFQDPKDLPKSRDGKCCVPLHTITPMHGWAPAMLARRAWCTTGGRAGDHLHLLHGGFQTPGLQQGPGQHRTSPQDLSLAGPQGHSPASGCSAPASASAAPGWAWSPRCPARSGHCWGRR